MITAVNPSYTGPNLNTPPLAEENKRSSSEQKTQNISKNFFETAFTCARSKCVSTFKFLQKCFQRTDIKIQTIYYKFKAQFSKDPAIISAIKNNNSHVACELIKQGHNPDARDSQGLKAIHLAAEYGHSEVVAKLLENGAYINETTRGLTALHIAVEKGHLEVVAKLLEKKADVNATDYKGPTVLHFAAEYGHSEAVAKLLENGADIDAENSSGDTALHCAAANGHSEAVAKLLENEADVNAKDSYGWTAVHRAAEKGYSKVVAKLLEKGADVNATNSRDDTALYLAVENGHSKVFDELLLAGATHNYESLNTLMVDVENHLNGLPEDTIVNLKKLNKEGVFCKSIPEELETDSVFSEYICPITHVPSLNLVQIIQNDREYFFDKDALKKWRSESNTNPMTRQEITQEPVEAKKIKRKLKLRLLVYSKALETYQASNK